MGLRNPVHLVEKHDIRDKFLEAARKRGYEWATKIIDRVPPDIDLIAADAQYHRNYQRKLYRAATVFTRGHRPSNGIRLFFS